MTFASDILKRDSDSIRCAVENDVFSSLPDESVLEALEKGPDDEDRKVFCPMGYIACLCIAGDPGQANMRFHLNSATQARIQKRSFQLWLMEMLTGAQPKIRLCKRCGKAFIADGSRAVYCSASCRNVANVANSRRRKKAMKTPGE